MNIGVIFMQTEGEILPFSGVIKIMQKIFKQEK
jgi:hypothetical protein